jgi:hypothetical protein
MDSTVQNFLLALGPLAGIWLGSHLTGAREGRQWQRDRRLDAYSDVLTYAEAITNESHKLFLDLFDDEAHQRDVLFETVGKFHRAVQRGTLLGPRAIVETLAQVSVHFDKIATSAGASPKMPHSEWVKLTTVDCGNLLGKFSEQARENLGVNVRIKRWQTNFGRVPSRENQTGGPLA